ncbi:MAG: hypothetical protein ABIP29_09590 [Candidatus Eisenbacteria bacterium]
MNRPREDARTALVLMLGLLLAAGCSKAPKPRADVPAAGTRTAGRNGNGTGTGAGTGAATSRRAPASAARPAPEAAARPAPEAGTRPADSVAGAQAGSSTSKPAVVPQLSTAEQERLERETIAAVEQAQRGLDAVEVAKLDPETHRKYLIAKDFLAQAGTARGRKEYERAQGLALKARLLAEEIASR